jgi:hypothetical protein
MRSIFSIWRDNGRMDYGIAPSGELAPAGKVGLAAVALLVVGIAVRGLYSGMAADDGLNSLTHAVPAAAIDAGRTIAGISESKSRPQPQTIGAAPIGFATTRFATPDRPPAPASPAVADARTVMAAADAVPPELAPAKVEEKPKVAKKKKSAHHAPATQVYTLPDGRQVAVQGAVRNAYGYVENRGFQPWDSFGGAPRQGRRAKLAQPGPFGF